MSTLTRRQFGIAAGMGLAGFGLAPLGDPYATAAASSLQAGGRPRQAEPTRNAISLATWSLNRSYRAGIWNLLDIARICREDFEIDGVEYVTIFFNDVRQIHLKQLNQRADDHGIRNVLIMVDQEGDMVSPSKTERMQAAINHRKWVDIAAYLGCHAIRCNATGGGASPEADPDALDRATESFGALLEYAASSDIGIIVENHGGGLASNAQWLVDLAEAIDNPSFGLLPDYGNFRVDSPEQRYDAVRATMPYARGVSVKGRWSVDGQHLRYSLEECLKISKAADFTGYWGIESSMRHESNIDDELSPLQIKNEEWQAVKWTKNVIDKVVFG